LDKKFPVLNIALVNKPIQKGGAPAVDIENLKNLRKLQHIEHISEKDRNSAVMPK